jgi:cephalosporin-C deacetylase-like acetyl esterase
MERAERFTVRVTRNVLIPSVMGFRSRRTSFLPDRPGQYPALVSYYPYHKDDLIGALFDHPNRYFAARGYASLLVDFRGLGNSEGVAWDTGDSARTRTVSRSWSGRRGRIGATAAWECGACPMAASHRSRRPRSVRPI